ncbi:hypothetical protein BaRGS_00018017, partial [Batillaria attramentaria]
IGRLRGVLPGYGSPSMKRCMLGWRKVAEREAHPRENGCRALGLILSPNSRRVGVPVRELEEGEKKKDASPKGHNPAVKTATSCRQVDYAVRCQGVFGWGGEGDEALAVVADETRQRRSPRKRNTERPLADCVWRKLNTVSLATWMAGFNVFPFRPPLLGSPRGVGHEQDADKGSLADISCLRGRRQQGRGLKQQGRRLGPVPIRLRYRDRDTDDDSYGNVVKLYVFVSAPTNQKKRSTKIK